MVKYSNVLDDRSGPPRHFGHRRTIVRFLLFVTLLASPLIYEGARVCIADWQSMTGAHREVETPMWNYVKEAYRSASDEFYVRIGSSIEPGNWSAGMAVPAVILIAFAGTFFLRGSH